MEECCTERQENHIQLTDLPDALLYDVSSFLSAANTGLLCVALTAPASSWEKCHWSQPQPPFCKILLRGRGNLFLYQSARAQSDFGWINESKKLDYFDFSYVIQSVTRGVLNDVDLKAVLICIDARNTIESLELSDDCIHITGSGLEPLRESTTLQRIDLSMNKFDSDDNARLQSIALSENAVLPILKSIIQQENQSIRHIQLPRKWKDDKSAELLQFLRKYNQALEYVRLLCGCKGCDNECDMAMHCYGKRFGTQTGTCYKCMKHFCSTEVCGSDPWWDYCIKCEKYLCSDCSPVDECSICNRSSCCDCGSMICSGCNKIYCDNCRPVHACDDCNDWFCEECREVEYCDECGTPSCSNCGGNGMCDACNDVRVCFGCGAFTENCCEKLVCNGCVGKCCNSPAPLASETDDDDE